jgi:hypothetical protein
MDGGGAGRAPGGVAARPTKRPRVNVAGIEETVTDKSLRFLLGCKKAVSRIPLHLALLAHIGSHRGLAAHLIPARDFSIVHPRAASLLRGAKVITVEQ